MILLKKYLISFFIFSFSLTLINSITVRNTYRSNSNGLSLIKIQQNQSKNFKYILQVDQSGDMILSKVLHKDDKEIKKWSYEYQGLMLTTEKFYKEKKLKEEYFYDASKHKIKQIEYLNSKPFKISIFNYNKDGLVDREEILNSLNNQTTVVKYRYDKEFRIKQIEKKYPDGRVVYWESFFTPKGIIIKEYYALKDEVFTFYYANDGQELEGEVKNKLPDGKENIKIKWLVFYSSNGRRERKEEENFLINKKTKFWYGRNGKETKVEIYYKDKIFSIENYEYNEKNKVIYYKRIEDLNLLEIYYTYDAESNLVFEKEFQDSVLKKSTDYKKDGSKTVSYYSNNKASLSIDYDKEGKIIKKK